MVPKRKRGGTPAATSSAPKKKKKATSSASAKSSSKKQSGSTTTAATTTTESVILSVDDLNDYDVLLGRGNGAMLRKGNVHFRCVVWEYKADYMAALRDEKMRLAEQVVTLVSQKGGRFLELAPGCNVKTTCPKDREYVPVPHARALEKTCQCLRERCPVPDEYQAYCQTKPQQEEEQDAGGKASPKTTTSKKCNTQKSNARLPSKSKAASRKPNRGFEASPPILVPLGAKQLTRPASLPPPKSQRLQQKWRQEQEEQQQRDAAAAAQEEEEKDAVKDTADPGQRDSNESGATTPPPARLSKGKAADKLKAMSLLMGRSSDADEDDHDEAGSANNKEGDEPNKAQGKTKKTSGATAKVSSNPASKKTAAKQKKPPTKASRRSSGGASKHQKKTKPISSSTTATAVKPTTAKMSQKKKTKKPASAAAATAASSATKASASKKRRGTTSIRNKVEPLPKSPSLLLKPQPPALRPLLSWSSSSASSFNTTGATAASMPVVLPHPPVLKRNESSGIPLIVAASAVAEQMETGGACVVQVGRVVEPPPVSLDSTDENMLHLLLSMHQTTDSNHSLRKDDDEQHAKTAGSPNKHNHRSTSTRAKHFKQNHAAAEAWPAPRDAVGSGGGGGPVSCGPNVANNNKDHSSSSFRDFEHEASKICSGRSDTTHPPHQDSSDTTTKSLLSMVMAPPPPKLQFRKSSEGGSFGSSANSSLNRLDETFATLPPNLTAFSSGLYSAMHNAGGGGGTVPSMVVKYNASSTPLSPVAVASAEEQLPPPPPTPPTPFLGRSHAAQSYPPLRAREEHREDQEEAGPHMRETHDHILLAHGEPINGGGYKERVKQSTSQQQPLPPHDEEETLSHASSHAPSCSSSLSKDHHNNPPWLLPPTLKAFYSTGGELTPKSAPTAANNNKADETEDAPSFLPLLSSLSVMIMEQQQEETKMGGATTDETTTTTCSNDMALPPSYSDPSVVLTPPTPRALGDHDALGEKEKTVSPTCVVTETQMLQDPEQRAAQKGPSAAARCSQKHLKLLQLMPPSLQHSQYGQTNVMLPAANATKMTTTTGPGIPVAPPPRTTQKPSLAEMKLRFQRKKKKNESRILHDDNTMSLTATTSTHTNSHHPVGGVGDESHGCESAALSVSHLF